MGRCIISRSRIIHASKDILFPLVSDLAVADSYEPWHLVEPSASFQYSENSSEVGGWSMWEGKLIGHGRREITEIFKDKQGVRYRLDFLKPRKSLGNIVEYRIEEQQDSPNTCKVTWSINMHFPWFLAPFMKSLHRSMDKMIGPDFELGLRRLAHLANKKEEPIADIILQDSRVIDTMHYIGSRFTRVGTSDIGPLCQRTYPKLAELLKQHNVEEKSAFIKYSNFNNKTEESDGVVALEVDEKDLQVLSNADPSLEIGSIPARYYSIFHHIGWPETLGYAWRMGAMRAMSLQSTEDKKKGALEIYKTMHNNEIPGVTEICFPIDKEKEQKIV